ncbi:hypothetical protein EPUS_02942 [Endocarpon pusillum Z07020]|uniref:Heterokaryon incompatibility domain-containing protein n=1 Tax=Endocarpon pusillum (strain Z07020 / HMAS-L-300199) TaxID=1263415 RepID=U1GJZ9_ENDPU|nr:uncharacterized protein EPUS_02942 [Endocarpon pusillum Z07020]ERF72151.1 hypothetical protein EPUS_02942 [Endocarpon pusillum Z07020]
MLYEEQAFHVELLVVNLLFLKRLEKRVFDGLLNMSIGRMNNGKRYYGVTKHGLMEINILKHRVFEPKDAISDESLSWVRLRINQCLESHSKCSKSSKNLLPTRILSFKKNSTGSIEVSLKETNNARGVYACFSHRWGASDQYMTTRGIYADMLQGIPWTSIPRTFQDAIKFSLSLGIENIWIDSLCIIQDDPSDWQAQAAQMASIYQNSYITLAATASSDSQSGCFWHSDASYEKAFQTEIGDFSVRKTLKHWERLWASNSSLVFPLLSRAWVFQERLLPSRVLHFSHHELVWECMEFADCQCGGYYVPSNPKSSDWTKEESWWLAVELYTSLHLTHQQDRLPAFFGFVSFYAQSTGASIQKDYFAGLWRKSLHKDLLWRIESSALDLGTPPTRLCLCFDGTRSIDGNWRCQYSYSAACSAQCLSQRQFCRYGQSDAAVPYDFEFVGSCSGREDGFTSIPLLRDMYGKEKERLSYDRSPYLAPSWSWASARTRVNFWNDVKGQRQNDCEVNHIEVNHDHQNLVGSIASALLRVNGHITAALLHYQTLPDPTNSMVRNHDILTYGLQIRDDKRLLDFHPDYVFSLEGEKWLPAGARVFLLHITSGVHMVLIEKSYFELDWEERLTIAESGSNQGNRLKDNEKYVRIGVFRIPDDRSVRYTTTYWANNIEIV